MIHIKESRKEKQKHSDEDAKAEAGEGSPSKKAKFERKQRTPEQEEAHKRKKFFRDKTIFYSGFTYIKDPHGFFVYPWMVRHIYPKYVDEIEAREGRLRKHPELVPRQQTERMQ
ncbi:hypothetical protein L596_000811 [Steinernema carpocapsae]|uniref:Uncharacterized protein n=1 Tax=Steinernema carpocapsae TaxID=34508 RepID=A0A4U8ULN1_STECR|nr:hypothetical protein L596_000811 [Steinernema carpocapsae]